MLGLLLAVTTVEAGSDSQLLLSADLGQRLFSDSRFSANTKVSCASCHRPELAFTDGLPKAAGVSAKQGTRNTPSLLDVADQRTLFWDGRRNTLEEQATDPLFNPIEHGLRDEAHLLSLLRADPHYPQAFRAAFGVEGSDIRLEHVARALAAFQRTLVSGPAPFDRHLQNDPSAMSPAARRGWELFSQRAQCTRCHVAEGPRPLFTDHGFHSLAIGLRRIERKLPELTQRLVALHRDGRVFDHEALADADIAELGRFAFTLDPADIGKFKTPGLRNVALTAPYMHDGSVATLEEAVDLELYYRGAQDGRPLILTPQERDDLVAFLKALTSDSPTPASPAGSH